MPDPVTIRYELHNGTFVEVAVHQIGHDESWVLDLWMDEGTGSTVAHQHSIEGEPEVEVG